MKVDKSKWEKKTLGEVACIYDSQRKPVAKSNRISGEYPYYGANGLQDYVSEYIFDGRYLLVGEDGGKWGAKEESTYIVEGKIWVNNHAHILQFENNVVDSFVRYYLNFADLTKYVTGSIVPKLTQANLKKITLLLPKSINEQQSIASELDTIQTMIDGYKAQLDDFDELAKSIFLDMFGDVSVNDKHWNITRLGELGALKNGINYDKGVSGIKIKFLGVGDFKDNKNLSSFDDISTIEIERIPKEYLLENGDIVFVRSNGNKKLVGRCMEVFPNGQEVTYSGFCIRFRKSADILNKYLVAVLTDDGFKRTHMHKSNGIGIQNINQKLLSQLPIPTPSISLQQRFAAKIEAIETQKEKYKAQLADAEQLMAERMQYYFS